MWLKEIKRRQNPKPRPLIRSALIPYVTGTCHIIIGKCNGGDASSFHFLSFLSFGFSVSTTTKAIPLALGGSSLVDSSAVPRRRLLSSRKEKGDVSIDGSARGKITAIWVESWWRYDDVSNGGSHRRRKATIWLLVSLRDADKRRRVLILVLVVDQKVKIFSLDSVLN